MSIVDKAVWIIERNSERPLTLEAIAAACGVSRSHLAYAFDAATGSSVIRYWRGRRLTEAARALAQGAPDILAVALDAGYGSHEAFTRAFVEHFGVTPESVRERRSLDGLALVAPLALKPGPELRLEPPRIVEGEALRVVGLAERFSWETVIKVPAQWQRFMAYFSAIPARLDRTPVGIGRATEEDGAFDYICGVEVARFGELPPELTRLEIPKCSYAVFQHRGHITALRETYVAIWNEALPAFGRVGADAPLIERHNPTFDPRTGEGGVALWIPLAA